MSHLVDNPISQAIAATLDLLSGPFGHMLDAITATSSKAGDLLSQTPIGIFLVALLASWAIKQDLFNTAYIGRFLGADRPHDHRALFLCHASLIVYAMCYWMCRPIRPYLTESLGADRVTLGYMDSFFSAAQIASSVAFGWILDAKGSRFGLVLAQAGTGFAYFGLFAASAAPANLQVPLLFASQVPGIFMAVMLCSQAALATVVSSKNKAKAMGRLSLSYGVGMTSGSWIGGALAERAGYGTVALIAACLTWGLAFFVLAPFLPNLGGSVGGGEASTASRAAAGSVKAHSRGKSGSGSGSAIAMLQKNPAFARLFLVTTTFGIAMSLYKSCFGVAVADHFKLGPAASGRLTSFSAVVSMGTNVIVVGNLVETIGARQVIMLRVTIQTFAFVLLTAASTAAHLMFLMVPMGIAGTVAYTVITSQMTELVSKMDAGKAVSMRHMIGGVTGLVTPPLGAYMMQEFGFEIIGGISATVCAFAILIYLPAFQDKLKNKGKNE